jgi:hypothetical protein
MTTEHAHSLYGSLILKTAIEAQARLLLALEATTQALRDQGDALTPEQRETADQATRLIDSYRTGGEL